jgi:hypothetical protein
MKTTQWKGKRGRVSTFNIGAVADGPSPTSEYQTVARAREREGHGTASGSLHRLVRPAQPLLFQILRRST